MQYAQSSPYTEAKILSRTTAVGGAVSGAVTGVGHFFTLPAENRKLTARIAELEQTLERERERLAELMARRGSWGYGRGVKSAEALELLHRLEKCSNPSFAPSGAPIMAELAIDEIKAKLAKN